MKIEDTYLVLVIPLY